MRVNNRFYKTVTTVIFCILLFMLALLGIVALRGPIADISKNKVYIFELGDKITLTPKTFGIKNTDVKVTSKQLNNSSKYWIKKDKSVGTKGSNYLGLGDYKATLSYNGTSKQVVIKVVDTTRPTFKITSKEIKMADGSSVVNLNNYFTVKDKDKSTTISAYTGGVDFGKAGTYTIKIIAEDSSGNKATRNCDLIIESSNDSSTESSIESKTISSPVYFFNSFETERAAKKAGDRIVEEGGASSYEVVDTGFDSYELILQDAVGVYASIGEDE